MAMTACEYCNRTIKYDARLSPPPNMHRRCRERKSTKEVLEMITAWEDARNYKPRYNR